MTNTTDTIYRKHMQALTALDSTWIDLTTFRYALRLALDECAQAHQPAADIAEEHKYLDSVMRRIEATIEQHDSGLYAALVEGEVELPTAVERLLNRYSVATSVARQDAAEMRQQLVQMDADNASLTQQLHAAHNGDLVFYAGKTRTVAEMLAALSPEIEVTP